MRSEALRPRARAPRRSLPLLLTVSIVASLAASPGTGAAAPDPAPGSARARLRDASTLDALHLFLYQTSGRVEHEYTAAQLARVATLYDLVTWVYAGSGVTPALRQGRPETIVTQYNDLTWVGDYDQRPGVKWMPMDWSEVDAHENFFAHSAAARPWSPKDRIPNPFFGWDSQGRPNQYLGTPHEWQANPFDLDEDNPGNIDRWVNYFTERTKALIAQDSMDGVMVDEAMQPYGLPPDGFEPEAWHAAVKRALGFARERLGPDAVMFWNGIMQDALLFPQDLAAGGGWARPRSLDYLESADGALIECYVTCYLDPFPDVWPQVFWEEIQDLCLEIDRRGGVLLALSPSGGDETRAFSLASFYLVKGSRSYYGRRMEWLPEYGVAMGSPLVAPEHISDLLVIPGRELGVSEASGVVYARPYESGLVLANPSERPATARLDRPGYLVVPEGGGGILPDGSLPAGTVRYEAVDTVELAPRGGALVVWEPPTA